MQPPLARHPIHVKYVWGNHIAQGRLPPIARYGSNIALLLDQRLRRWSKINAHDSCLRGVNTFKSQYIAYAEPMLVQRYTFVMKRTMLWGLNFVIQHMIL